MNTILDLTKIISTENIKIRGIIHVGAHYGEQHSIYKNWEVNRVIYFEPIKGTFETLSKRITDAELYNFALGNQSKAVEMYVERQSQLGLDACGMSSVLTPISDISSHFNTEKQKVEMRRLDEFNFTDCNFLNIDTQGYELEVLKGSENTLNYIDCILIEVWRNNTTSPIQYKGAPVIEEITNFLENHGFILHQVDWAGGCWGDAFYKKQNLHKKEK
jgi:FkbM family methyltransferase